MLAENQWVIFNRYGSRLNQLEAPLQGEPAVCQQKTGKLLDKVRVLLPFGDQANMFPAWLPSRDLSSVLSRPRNFAWLFSSGFLNFPSWRKVSIPWKTAEGTWKSSLFQQITIFWEDGMVKLPEILQREVEENGETVVQLCCW